MHRYCFQAHAGELLTGINNAAIRLFGYILALDADWCRRILRWPHSLPSHSLPTAQEVATHQRARRL